MTLETSLSQLQQIVINQRRELVELLGFETRNKYSIDDINGAQIGYAAEQQKGILGMLLRQILGHWRRFDVLIFNADRELRFRAQHPFRFYFERLELLDPSGKFLGALQRRFTIFSKHFDIEDEHHRVVMTVRSPIWHIWKFTFERNGSPVAEINKQWKGILQEAFTDTDRFLINYLSPKLTVHERALILAAGIFVDLLYFEQNQPNAGRSVLDLFTPD